MANNTSGFYKVVNKNLLYAPNFVLHADYELRKENKDQLTYPVDGWYWFDDEAAAREFFDLPKPSTTDSTEKNKSNWKRR